MSVTGRLTSTLTISSGAPGVACVREGSGNVGRAIDMTAGYAGTISSGTVTAAGHNVSTGEKVAVFWSDATTGLPKRRYNITAGTVSGSAVPIGSGGGSGDTLPTSGSVIICHATIVSTLALTGSLMKEFIASCDQRGLLQIFSDAGTTSILVVDAAAARDGLAWADGQAMAVPFSAAIAQCNAYNGSTRAATWTLAALLT